MTRALSNAQAIRMRLGGSAADAASVSFQAKTKAVEDLIPDDAGLDNYCIADFLADLSSHDDRPWSGRIPQALRVAAVINWFGPTDLSEMVRESQSYVFDGSTARLVGTN